MSFKNFLLISRVNSHSTFERFGDFCLTPARILFNGKKVVVFNDNSIHTISFSQNKLRNTVAKVISVAFLPFVLLGLLIKLTCLNNKNYRKFYTTSISEKKQNPKLFEMHEHIHNIRSFIAENNGDEESGDSGSRLSFKPLNLYECSCENTQAFHRLKHPRRNNVERAIVEQLVKNHPDVSQPLHLISLGSGGLMADFITLEKLILAGFKNISLDCIDPQLDFEKIERIRKFFSEDVELSITINGYKSFDVLPKKEIYSAVLAVDFDSLTGYNSETSLSCAKALSQSCRLLNETGFVALAFGQADVLYGKEMEPITITQKTSFINDIASDLISRLTEKEEMHISTPAIMFASVGHLLIYAIALACDKKGMTYRKISLSYLNEEKNSMASFKELLSIYFPHSEIELSLHKDDNKYDIYFDGTLERNYKSKKYLDFLNPDSVSYIFRPSGDILRQVGEEPLTLIYKK